jgi:DNA transformation protein and related proteins
MGMDADTLRELFRDFGSVDVRRMFGGMGIFADGLMIALVARGEVYLKADAETIPSFEREKLGPFGYATKNGERVLTSYWRMPERLYDDADELARWARDAHAVALRANAAKSKPRPKAEAKNRQKAKKR